MKEVTVWDNRPRYMWAWDTDEEYKSRELVTCILTDEQMTELGCEGYPVCGRCCNYKHCAEIEETKRPCTREELLGMLKQQGLSFLLERTTDRSNTNTGYTVDIRCMDDKMVTLENGQYLNYENLCEYYTLLNGAELWIKE